MKTYCPGCQTVFRITAEQLNARSGKVRCGQCRRIFNALDRLLDESESVVVPAPVEENLAPSPPLPTGQSVGITDATVLASETTAYQSTTASGCSFEDAGSLTLPNEHLSRPPQWRLRKLPANLPINHILGGVSAFLALVLAGQIVFHFRGVIAIAVPSLRPVLSSLSEFAGADLPLPRNADLISIESSDLQSEPGKNRPLLLQATLRNSARHAQAYPALELSLTDTRDKTIARRVLLPEEYLPTRELADATFAANGEVEVRLSLETKDLTASGYRLYAFYP